MNIKANYKYQILSSLNSFKVFYLIILCVTLLMFVVVGCSVNVKVGGSEGGIGGLESATAIYLFVFALASYKEEMNFSVLNAKPRNNFFLSKVLSLVSICFALAVVDNVLGLAIRGVAALFPRINYQSLVEMAYQNMGAGVFGTTLLNVVYCTTLNMGLVGFGTLLTAINYKLGKSGKIAFWVSFGVILVVILPIVEELLPNAFLAVVQFIAKISSSALSMLFAFAVFALCLAATYLLLRKQEAKKNTY